MAPADPVEMASYELPLSERSALQAPAAAGDSWATLSKPLLVRNALWFCRLRWIVVAGLMIFGLLGMSKQAMEPFGLLQPGPWPLILAGVLTVGNAAFLIHARVLGSRDDATATLVNLWAQIILDLLVLTAVVHFLGSVRTYLPFAFLFHIVLSCVFFSSGSSLIVVLAACGLFAACVVAEHLGLVRAVPVFSEPALHRGAETTTSTLVDLLSALGIWLLVWYLAAHLSAMVRRRDRELAATNRRLLAAQQERSRHMLTTTHQLKAPFAAVYANTQLLLEGHCGTLPDAAMPVLHRIAARCRRLAKEIQEMLQLANLGSTSQDPAAVTTVELDKMIDWCIDQVAPTAAERYVTIEKHLEPTQAVGVEEHLKMMFSNLLTNAVSYSYPGGHVRVQCRLDGGSGPVVTIADEGIGIPAEKIPHIFEEHYRTNEAVRHNKESSGLGLAIVRQVVEKHLIRLRVKSRVGHGSVFELEFPPREELSRSSAAKEKPDGLSTDRG